MDSKKQLKLDIITAYHQKKISIDDVVLALNVSKRSVFGIDITLQDVLAYPKYQGILSLVVFDSGGNKVRIITKILFGNLQLVNVTHVLDHAEYDKKKWKE